MKNEDSIERISFCTHLTALRAEILTGNFLCRQINNQHTDDYYCTDNKTSCNSSCAIRMCRPEGIFPIHHIIYTMIVRMKETYRRVGFIGLFFTCGMTLIGGVGLFA